MAKTPRTAYPDLPLSAEFYALLRQLGARHGFPLDDVETLGQAVAELSQLYTRQRDLLGAGRLGERAPLARLGFFLPRDLIKIFGPLGELQRAGRLPARSTLRVLDLGAGLGASTLGLARFLCHAGLPDRKLEVVAVERDLGASHLMRALCTAVAQLHGEFARVELKMRAADLRELREAGPFDLVLLGFVLNELYLEQPEQQRGTLRASLLRTLASQLERDGALIVLEPALKDSARELMRVRDALAQGGGPPFVFAPCVRSGPCPMLVAERDWCHESLDFGLPPPLAAVAQRAGLRFQGLSYAALVLSNQPRGWPSVRGQRYRVVSDRLRSKGKLELFGCGELGYQRLTRLDRDASPDNRELEQLRRGDIVELPDAQPRVARDSHVQKH